MDKYTRYSFKFSMGLCCFLAAFIYLIRIVFERFIATPIGKMLSIKDKLPFKPNSQLEIFYNSASSKQEFTDPIIMMESRRLGFKFDMVKQWLAARKSLNRPSQLQKFNECCWRFTFYVVVWVYGLYVLKDKIWFYDTNWCWKNYPNHLVSDDIYFYYIIEISFYFSLLASQFSDVKRKDFWQMFLHHIVTLTLLIMSLLCNFSRIGSLVLLLHDTADPWLEMAKMGSYAKLKKICDPVFAGFALVWLISRLIVYPYVILYTTTFEIHEHISSFPSYYVFSTMLQVLQIMHVIWFWMILRVAYKALFTGVTEDDRESNDGSSSDEQHDHKE